MTEFSISKNKLWLWGLSIAIFSAMAILLFTNNRESKKSISSETILTSNLTKDISSNTIASKEPIKILFVGDMMFDRYVREAVGKYGDGNYNYIFNQMKEKLAEYDLVVGNLEGPITDKNSVSVNTALGESKNFVFTFDSAVAKALFDNNIKLVNLGNNHMLNQGEDGVIQTKKYLDDAEVQYFGDIGEMEVEPPRGGSTSKAVEINGTKISFVNYNYSVAGSFEKAIEDIKIFKKKSDIVIACPHWGTEYKVGDPGDNIRNLAYQFIDAGADLIIGTHPHVVQTSEVYQGKKIYYSLGNFIFDQYFQKETKEGLAVEVTINPKNFSLDFKDIPLVIQTNGQTKVK